MNDLEMYREQLAICDDKIIDALVERNAIIEKIMAYKETYGMPILQPAQEAKQQRRLDEKLKDNNYLGSVADTAENVAAFTESLREDEDPVVLVFFGDHKPTLGNANSIYAELNMDLNRSSDEGFRNFYSTPYWIWMNDTAKEALDTDPAGQGPDIGPYYLMAQVFQVCGWTGPSYLQYQQELRQTLPAIHAEGTYLENGVRTKELSVNSQKLLEKQEIMEYYLKRTKYK